MSNEVLAAGFINIPDGFASPGSPVLERRRSRGGEEFIHLDNEIEIGFAIALDEISLDNLTEDIDGHAV